MLSSKGEAQRSLVASVTISCQFGSIQSQSQKEEVGKKRLMNEMRFLDHSSPTLRDSC